jgi:hypothetical protein
MSANAKHNFPAANIVLRDWHGNGFRAIDKDAIVEFWRSSHVNPRLLRPGQKSRLFRTGRSGQPDHQAERPNTK